MLRDPVFEDLIRPVACLVHFAMHDLRSALQHKRILNSTAQSAHADPAPGSDVILSSSIDATQRSALLPDPIESPQSDVQGYQIGQRITVARLESGILAEDHPFALPYDSMSSTCTDGGWPVGAGHDTPLPAATVCIR